MQSNDVKIALQNYHRFKKDIETTQWKIEELNARKFKAGGSIAKCPENPIDRSTVIINNLGKGEMLEESLSWYRYNVNLAEAFINALRDNDRYQDKSMIQDRFIYRKSMNYVCEKYAMDRKTVWRRIEFLLEKFMDLT